MGMIEPGILFFVNAFVFYRGLHGYRGCDEQKETKETKAVEVDFCFLGYLMFRVFGLRRTHASKGLSPLKTPQDTKFESRRSPTLGRA
jgi:hypothetical protein